MMDRLWQVQSKDVSCEQSSNSKQILTGATGALGAHLLDQLRKKDDVSQILCLVRASNSIAAQERVSKSLVQRKRDPLEAVDGKVSCLVAKLGDEKLGLSDEVYNDIAGRASIIIHAAWAVNFSMRLRSFAKDHLAGEYRLRRINQRSLLN